MKIRKNKKVFNWLLVSMLSLTSLYGCQLNQKIAEQTQLEKNQLKLKNYDTLTQAKVMVVGVNHFDKSILKDKSQKAIEKLVDTLKQYKPSKIIVEWEPTRNEETNKAYQSFLDGHFDISQRENEVYQIGFRLAKVMAHNNLYLFDDQTEYIGSLKNFSFQSFGEYAKENDKGFYDKYEALIISNYAKNQGIFKALNAYDHIALLNSPEAQKINRQRMHMYEVRAGIQKNWIGPDWLGRWYRRNIRMMSNVLKLTEKDDRILIIVGSNHKWVLDQLFESTPEFDVVSSWKYLNNDND